MEGIPTRHDDRLIVGYDKSDDASVYVINDELALVQTVDFFPPIVDDPFLFGQIAAANALSDVYAMGAEPKLAMNVMCINSRMGTDAVRAILEGGYDKVYEAGALITGGHTIEDKEPKYGLSVTGFVHPQKLLRNSSASEGDMLILTKPLGSGILTTAAQGDMVDAALMSQVYQEMAQLNKTARDCMVKYDVHGCTDVTGFALLGHAFEMAQGSGLTLHFMMDAIPYHQQALEMAAMGFIPAGAYRNREYTKDNIAIKGHMTEAMMDILYDPQTSGGLLIAVSEKDGTALLKELQGCIPCAEIIGYVTAKEEMPIIVE
ncbi:MAG: selenide, water dikinase SelD [Megasphaera sp.]|nr:selenide, water dikinase SelD [Megasphaera sp.]